MLESTHSAPVCFQRPRRMAQGWVGHQVYRTPGKPTVMFRDARPSARPPHHTTSRGKYRAIMIGCGTRGGQQLAPAAPGIWLRLRPKRCSTRGGLVKFSDRAKGFCTFQGVGYLSMAA